MVSKLSDSSFDTTFSNTTPTKTLSLYKQALEASQDGIFIIDVRLAHYPIIYCNSAFETITGYSRQEVMGSCWLDLHTNTEIKAALQQGKAYSGTQKSYRKDGTIFWYELTLSPIYDFERDGNGNGDGDGHRNRVVTHFTGIQRHVTQPQQVEETELRHSQDLYRTLARNLPNGVVLLFDDEFRYLVADGEGMANLQLSKEQIEGKTLWEIFEPKACETFAPAYREALAGKESSWEYDYQGSSFRVYVRPVTDEAGVVFAGMVMTQDITELKHSQRQLQRNNTLLNKQKESLRTFAKREFLVGQIAQRIRQSLNLDDVLKTAVEEVRSLLQTDRVILYQFAEDWSGTVVVESVSPNWKATIGMEIQDNCFQTTHAPLYREGRVKAIEDIYNAGLTPCHIQLLERCQVRANLVVPVLQGKTLWGLLIAHHCESTREWKKTETQLLQQISVQLAIALQQAALFEQVKAELEERVRAEAALKASETQLKEKALELENALRELQTTQTQLIQSEKMSSLGQMVAGIAHEINNPVSFVGGNINHASGYANDLLELVDLYNQHYPEPVSEIQDFSEEIEIEFLQEDFPQLLQSMKMGTERIQKIVQSLRNFSRLDEAERKLANLHEGIDNSLMILHHRFKKNQEIELIKNYGELPKVECYPGQLNQVFINILANAIDALEEAELDQTPQIKVTTEVTEEEGKSWAVIRIADNGLGISEENCSRIFDPFFTTKPVGKGTGLGLSVSYSIVVERHSGKLDCVSTPGEGTEFIIQIPL